MITYQVGNDLPISDVIAVYQASSLGARRPITDVARMTDMFANSNLVISAWSDGQLVGLARALSDFSYATYLSDLVVMSSFQRQGIGHQLIKEVQKVAPQANLILLAAPQAEAYYPHIGFEQHDSAWVLKQE